MIQIEAPLVERRIDGAIQELRLHAPELTKLLQPGQPVLIRTSWGMSPFLRRTFYPVALAEDSFLIRVPPSGDRGFAWLRMAPIGARLDCMGPVGRGFALPQHVRRVLCLGEGEWAWVLLPVIEQAVRDRLSVTLAVEARPSRHPIPARRLPLAVEYRLFGTDRGRGKEERLSARFPELLPWADVVFAAGSPEFYAGLRDSIEVERVHFAAGFAQVLHPAHFFCGFGACQACATDVAGGRRRVCLRGPVFDLFDYFR
ncbi:MAG: hypothetical protein D6775_08100 [Caldilineae bacterium]|nr:MAG: hypothetical protein D6775_08100 [Caldilineae bacterium]